MPQPDAYTRQYDFEDFQSSNPTTPLPATQVENELDAVKHALDETQDALELIQRDDGALRNGIVTPDSLSAATRALIAATGGTIRGPWATATNYAIRDVVSWDDVGAEAGTYVAATAHTSGTFATDLAAGKWVLLALASPVDVPVPVLQGGTGATSATQARTNLGAAVAGTNDDITELAALAVPLSVDQGGTGADTAAGARAALSAAKSGANSDITSLAGLSTPLSVAQGGTGADSALAALAALGARGAGDRQVFTGSGTFSKASLPAWVTRITVHVWGAGGGGGGGHTSSIIRGAGGGGGGYAHKRIAVSALGTSETVTVGAGGAGGTSGTSISNGAAGGTSSFGSHCSATGGSGGSFASGTSVAGGAGGAGSGGDINLTGQAGGLGSPQAGAGTLGGVMFGAGGDGAMGGAGAISNVAVAGLAPGGGGSGGNHAGGTGGAGGAGLVVVEW